MHLQIWLLLSVAVISVTLISSNILAFAQTNTTATKTPVKAHGVKITSPTKGQKVQINNDKSFIVTGISIDNKTSDCQVSVILNNIKPYKNATATGSGGNNDYSNWTFTSASIHSLVKQGSNKITAKFSCNGNPNLLSYYSVNVTGIGSSSTVSNTSTISPSTSTQKNVGANSTVNNIIVQKKSTSITNSSKPTLGPITLMHVKITSPTKGQKTSIDNLKVVGTSSDNTTSDCQVSVILNNIKPYQKAKGTGLGGLNDYSNWTFTPNKKNHQITIGDNELTAKLSCSDGSATHTKYYSVNVTGVDSTFKSSKQETSQSHSTANNTEPFIFPIPSNNKPVFVP